MGIHFVLIHGAWHGAWCWEGVIKALEEAGHTAEAPTMPGHQLDDDRSRIKFDDYVTKIIQTLNRQEAPVVLAGHSSAGFLLQSALDRHGPFLRVDSTALLLLLPLIGMVPA